MTVYRVENMEHGVSFIEGEGLTPFEAAKVFIGNGEGYSDFENLYYECRLGKASGGFFPVYDSTGEHVDDLMVHEYVRIGGDDSLYSPYSLYQSEEEFTDWIRSLYDHRPKEEWHGEHTRDDHD